MTTEEKPPVYRYDFGQLFRQYVELIRPRRRLFLMAASLITLIQMLAIVESVLFGKIVQTALHRNADAIPHLMKLSTMVVGATLSASLLTGAKAIALRRAIIGTVDDLLQTCLAKMTRLNGPYLELNNATNLFGRVLKGVDRTEGLSWQLAHELLPLALTFFGTLIAVAFIAPVAILVLLPTIMLFTTLTIWVRARFVQLRKHRHTIKRASNALFGEIVQNLRTILANNQQGRMLLKHRALEAEATAMLYREYDFYDRVDVFRGQIIGIARLAVFVTTLAFGWNDPALGGQIVMLSLLSERLLRACYSIGSIYDRFIDACEPINEMTEILNEPEPITDPDMPKTLANIRGDLTFDHVTFAYSSDEARLALNLVNFTIQAGETVGIVGESGGGKSTVVKLLLRFLDPTQGSVRLDGVDLRDLRQFDVRRSIGYVPQTVEIFDGTVRDNILFGAPDATDEEMIAAAKLAHAHEFITMFTDGYATRVGDRGLRLSGGQIQRIGLARALLRNPQIILLDEATASVDVRNDVGIHRSIREIAKTGKTVIIIAHRLSTVKDADRLICLDQGQIVETGTPEELRHRTNGYYATLLATQQAFDRGEHPSALN